MQETDVLRRRLGHTNESPKSEDERRMDDEEA